jgi:hypothetical protein
MYFLTKYASKLIFLEKENNFNHNGHLKGLPFRRRKYLRFHRIINGLKNVL